MRVLIGCPTSSGAGVLNLRSHVRAQLECVRRGWTVETLEARSSLLTWSFNVLWAEALNRRGSGLTHFLLLHSDVRPAAEDWLGVLVEEMEKAQAQVLSVIVPIKSAAGVTSTARESGNPWRPTRLTQKQVLALPPTWTADDLLFNTGCLLVDFRDPWVEKVAFTINDAITMVNGKWSAEVEPEDWQFSRQCRALGVRCFVTRAVVVEHFGTWSWRSDAVWGRDEDEK